MNYCALLIYVLGKETDGIYSLWIEMPS
jgi:hypothetical protein